MQALWIVSFLLVAAPASGLVTLGSQVAADAASEIGRETGTIGFLAHGAAKHPAQTTATSALPIYHIHNHSHYHHYHDSAQSKHTTVTQTTANTNFCENPVGATGRVWFMCKGKKFEPQTPEDLMLGVEVGNEMCCTAEMDAACLCCLDFSQPLKYDRCGIVELDAAQKAGGLQVDDPNKEETVILCTAHEAVGAMAKDEHSAGTAILPLECVGREFTIDELTGNAGPPAGEILFNERLTFLKNQGIPGPKLPTCHDTLQKSNGGKCPAGTPKARNSPNSASPELIKDLTSSVNSLSSGASNEQKTPRWLKKQMSIGKFVLAYPNRRFA